MKILFILHVICSFCSYAQYPLTKPFLSSVSSRFNDTVFSIETGNALAVNTLRSGTLHAATIDPDKPADVIVEFRESPFFINNTASRSIQSAEFYRNRFQQFQSDLQMISQNMRRPSGGKILQPVIHRKWYKVFFGANILLPQSLLSSLLTLPYVKSIHRNEPVFIHVEDAIRITRVDSVWNRFQTFGEGIVIGILDTGIDYLHPALGGAIGPSHKVVGGYDVVNDDDDPMDDNGHGTHVAGIASADGDSISGIAPKAKLMAFKVLNQSGYGSQEKIIEGIERSADPNGDDDPADRVDILNISLGGFGTPDDALSTTVNHAAELGMILCVSAGNNFGFQTIGSPGNAARAITVGAVEDDGRVARFSSKGPTRKQYTMKPDLLAPGVDIRSTYLQQSIAVKSGTSMSTPIISGICALIKSLHPEWDGEMIKSALMNNAVDVGAECMIQGAGRVDAVNAVTATSFAFPQHLSFGLDSSNHTVWSVQETLVVKNISDKTKEYNAKFSGADNGVDLQADPVQFTLPGGDSTKIIVTMNVNNTVVPYPKSGSLTYSGSLALQSPFDTLRVPWSFVKAARVLFTFNEPAIQLVVSNSDFATTGDEMIALSPTTVETVLPAGTYDISALFLDAQTKIVVREMVHVQSGSAIAISSDSALHSVTAAFVDNAGKPFSDPLKGITLLFPDSSLFASTAYFSALEGPSEYFVSTISNRMRLICSEFDVKEDREMFSPFRTIDGISGNYHCTNLSSEYYSQNLIASLPLAGSHREYLIHFLAWSLQQVRGNDYRGYGVTMLSPFPTQKHQWNGIAHFFAADGNVLISPSAEIHHRSVLGGTESPWMRLPPLAVVHDSILSSFSPFQSSPAFLSPVGGTLRYGESPIFTDGLHVNNLFSRYSIGLFPSFFGQLEEEKFYQSATYRITDENNNIIAEDTLRSGIQFSVSGRRYQTEVTYRDYFVKEKIGKGTMTAAFDLRQSDASPPSLTSLKLINSQHQTVSHLNVHEQGKLIFSAADINNAITTTNGLSTVYQPVTDSVKVYARTDRDTLWISLPMTLLREDSMLLGKIFTADVSAWTKKDSVAVDLALEFFDLSGNRLAWRLEPAFSVGAYSPTNVESVELSLQKPKSFVLHQNFPNPFNPETEIRCEVPQKSTVTLTVYDILGRMVAAIHDGVLEAGTHRFRWNGKDIDGRSISCGMYVVRLEAGRIAISKKMIVLR